MVKEEDNMTIKCRMVKETHTETHTSKNHFVYDYLQSVYQSNS